MIGATGVYIQQIKFHVRDWRRFNEKISRIILGFDANGNPLQVTLDSQNIEFPAPSTSSDPDSGRKTPKGGKGVRGKKGAAEDEEEEEDDDEDKDDKGGGKGAKRKKGAKAEGTPKKRRKVLVSGCFRLWSE